MLRKIRAKRFCHLETLNFNNTSAGIKYILSFFAIVHVDKHDAERSKGLFEITGGCSAAAGATSGVAYNGGGLLARRHAGGGDDKEG